jgi:hypothetical protein
MITSGANLRIGRNGQLLGRGLPSAFDADALAYITAVETSDGETLEAGVKTAINDFVVGCKADAIWDALKASCILAGARTLNGALVPLVGTAPTNFNFVSGDYNRKTGLVGDGSTKYLNSNRNNNADPQNSNHNAAYVYDKGNTNGTIMAAGVSEVGANAILHGFFGEVFTRNRSSQGTAAFAVYQNGLVGTTREVSSSYIVRNAGNNATISISSQAPFSGNVLLYRRALDGSINPSSARLSFYSIGESLDLAALDTRVSALMTAIDGAIA